ncbi:MAG: hypothetical protein A2541_01440 [Candidatus Taylorbacteria bacterium RIFOXYD2_FULL_36_9]|uniref:EfeO-type cupredoxin-like domain-containing protein n=1 Tax=Candidatus Taylorbacteria bacterium RIFOXYD2_FULL_36_9 TaxID=1802338 RepID=A0A1G2PBX9_9BACT|nr:MAG: hypothetical protein A2541_01440 [Candidatus Taylorbacteria bacterium RIFOXYD2_FULL_36_9]
MQNKNIAISIIIAGLIIGGTIFFSSQKNNQVTTTNQQGNSLNPQKGILSPSNNVSIENGVQIITLQAKGGYQPRQSVAKAGIPTIIRFNTSNTFDCSRTVRIPSLNYSKTLPQTGNTDVNLNSPSAGLFRGSCGMGMYPFEIDFQD